MFIKINVADAKEMKMVLDALDSAGLIDKAVIMDESAYQPYLVPQKWDNTPIITLTQDAEMFKIHPSDTTY